jgi:hypothetical protein
MFLMLQTNREYEADGEIIYGYPLPCYPEWQGMDFRIEHISILFVGTELRQHDKVMSLSNGQFRWICNDEALMGVNMPLIWHYNHDENLLKR